MSTSNKAPKQWSLGKEESVNSFNAWKENLIYVLSQDKNFVEFLQPNVTWLKNSCADINRGFTDDVVTDPPTEGTRTKEQKVAQLNLLLGQIANYATIISRNQIVKNSVSLNDVWSKLREHYGLHTSGSK